MQTRRGRLDRISHSTRFNAGLWFDKFIGGQESPGEREIEHRPYRKQLMAEAARTPTPDLYGHFFWRWKEALGALGAKCPVEAWALKADARVLVGIGAESASEVSVTLHKTYGVPVIPGSGLKGLAARYARVELSDPEWRLGGRAYEAVFGSQSSAGYVTFHDALFIPEGTAPLAADVMTAHHPGYYQGGDPPADWDDPRPVPFLSARGAFLLAVSGEQGTGAWVSKTVSILRTALREYGVGAKTSSGYGRAELLPPPMSEEERRRAEEVRARGNIDLQEQAVTNVIGEVEALRTADKETKKQLKKIADSRVLGGRFTDEQKRRVGVAIRAKVEELKLDVSSSEWFPKVLRRLRD